MIQETNDMNFSLNKPAETQFRFGQLKKKRTSRLNLSFYSLSSGNTSDVELNIWEINKREA